MMSASPTHFTFLDAMVPIVPVAWGVGIVAVPLLLGSLFHHYKWRTAGVLVLLAIYFTVTQFAEAAAAIGTCDDIPYSPYGSRCVAFDLELQRVGRMLLMMLPAFAVGATAQYAIDKARSRNAPDQ